MTIETKAFALTREEYIQMYAALYRKKADHARITCLSVAATSAVVAWFALSSSDPMWIAIGGAAAIVALLYAWSGWQNDPMRYARYAIREFRLEEVEPHSFRISPDELVVAEEAGCCERIKATTIRRLESDHVLILSISGNMGLVLLPERVFHTDDDYAEYLNWARELPSA